MFCIRDFLEEFPEFMNIKSSVVQRVGNREDGLLSDTAWGDLREYALFLRIAHRLALRYDIGSAGRQFGIKNGASAGIVTSKSASSGSLSESTELNSFARSENPIYADFGRTEYGLEYIRLAEETLSEGSVILGRSIGNGCY